LTELLDVLRCDANAQVPGAALLDVDLVAFDAHGRAGVRGARVCGHVI
jgi:hypothetical protein